VNAPPDLRPYQSRTIASARAAFAAGAHGVCVVLPTGGGKTHVAAEMARAATERGRRVLWLTHRLELVEQSAARVPWADVRSVQGLLASGERPEAGLVILDEAHHFGEGAVRWTELARHYATVPTVGLTATPERGDGTGLTGVFDALVAEAGYGELIRDGYLVPAEVYSTAVPPNTIAEPLGPWLEHARGKRTVVFAHSVERAAELADRWRQAGYRAAHVVGEQDKGERHEAVERFRAGELDVLANVYVLTEGFDVPGVECVVLARGFGSCGSYLQACGRALRPAPGKSCAVVLDCAQAYEAHGMPDEDRAYSLDGRGVRARDREVLPRMCRVCGFVFVSLERVCPRCGAYSDRPETKAERALRLEKIERAQARHDEDRRAEVYSSLVERGRRLGYRPGWAKVQYKVRYGCWPSGPR
jgi:superfamily II DNA or RNA helicase